MFHSWHLLYVWLRLYRSVMKPESLEGRLRTADTELTPILRFMTHDPLIQVSCGAEQSLKGFSKWWNPACSGRGDQMQTSHNGTLPAQQTLSSTSWLSIYCQGQASLLTCSLISWLMVLSTIGIYRCQHHFNVCMINISINTQNIPLSSYGGFVEAYVPIRLILVRSDRACGLSVQMDE